MTRALLQKVQIARRQLKLADDDYRAILGRVTGCSSSTQCSERQLEAMLAEFKRLGGTPTKGSKAPISDKPYVRKIYALWKEAGIVGAVENASKEMLRGFVERQTRQDGKPGKSAPEFLTPAEANKVSEGIKARIKRAEAR